MVVDGAVVMVENIVRHLNRPRAGRRDTLLEQISDAAHEVQRPVFYAIAIIITAYLPIFTLQRVEGKLVQAHGLDGGFRPAGRADLLHADCAGAGELPVPQRTRRMAQPGDGISHALVTAALCAGPSAFAGSRWESRRLCSWSAHLSGVRRRDRIGVSAASG